MAIKVGSNFTFQGKQPNFERDRFATKAAMKAFPETSIDDGHLSYCAEDGNTYQFKSSNSVDAVIGKWRMFKADVDLSAYATKDSVAADLAKKVNIRGIPSSNSAEEGKPQIQRIVTINVSPHRYQTGFLGLTLMCRAGKFIHVLITINNDKIPGAVNVVETSIVSYAKEPLYYVHDTANSKVMLYYKMDAYDTITAKVTDKDANMDFTWEMDFTPVDTLPEGAIQVHNINYENKNLFYATPKNAAGDPKFRTIDVADLPDLSSKYATKEKAFTKDTISTEPNQFLAGPINTKGNISLRKIDISDIPDLSKKYQLLDRNGFQYLPKMSGVLIGFNVITGNKSGYLRASIPRERKEINSPDWYYATDGTLQNIKTKIPKVVLDDAVSTTSDNGVKNSVITEYVDSKVTTINSSIADIRTSLESTQTDFVDLRYKVNAMPKTVFITQAAYNALTTKDANTIYYING